jgi:hypothetical protein
VSIHRRKTKQDVVYAYSVCCSAVKRKQIVASTTEMSREDTKLVGVNKSQESRHCVIS